MAQSFLHRKDGETRKRIFLSQKPVESNYFTIYEETFIKGKGLQDIEEYAIQFGLWEWRVYWEPRLTKRSEHKYRLVGVVEHLGSMRGGHYVAYIRGGTKSRQGDEEHGDFVWYYASDAYVREASLEEVLRCEAYILFYAEI
ncbi:hypothetical protein RJ640_022074 [Escallonia rubra]|uniref:USP domain-containing protein n=1 Tax=Escallonia rubra TaxID=112253 RepID=A0AA88UHB7_9ASTE|nr:hypothetical protein RJ640_022074 [Escallonia rubra]